MKYEIKPYANLRNANLSGANLSGANLNGADLDFSVFPLWCGSFGMKIDDRIFRQIVYHLQRLDTSNCSKEIKRFLQLKSTKSIANKFHRAKECGEIE